MKSFKLFIGLCLFAGISASHAGLIECGSKQRTASFDSATSCVTGLGNPKVSTINDNFSSISGWTNAGELTDNGKEQFLSANLTSGSWGSSPIVGNWQIDDEFWNIFGQAAISVHVGNGGGDPDYFSWLIEDKATSGTWAYELRSGKGGGLSNIKLWGSNSVFQAALGPSPQLLSTSITDFASNSISVREPAIILLFALGVLGLSATMKGSKKPH